MAITQMDKMVLVGLKKDKKNFIKIIQELGIVEFIEVKQKELKREFSIENLNKTDASLSKLESAISIVSKYAKQKKVLFGLKKVNLSQMAEISYKANELLDISERIINLDEEIKEVMNNQLKLTNSIAKLKPWINLDVPIKKLNCLNKVNYTLGMVSKKVCDNFITETEDIVKEVFIEKLGENNSDAFILVIYHKNFKDKIDRLYTKYGLTKYRLDTDDVPKNTIRDFQLEIDRMKEKITNIKSEIVQNEKYLYELKVLYDYYKLKKERIIKSNDILNSNKTFYIEGWVPEKSISNVKKVFEELNCAFYIDFSKPDKNEEFPILLKNNKFVTPFEVVTEFYSLPKSREIDPDSVMAPFYFVFYGMMIGDAGYGLVLAILTFIASKLLPLKGMVKKLVQLIMLGGISTFIWGAMFGSWFGNLLKFKPLWFDPLKDPMKLLIFSFILGVIQIFTGMAMKAYINIRDGKVIDAIFDQGFWYIFLIGIIMFLIPQTSHIAKYFALTGAVLLILTQGRQKKNIIMKLLSGVISLYGVTGILGDVLSYSRILALGLATTVVATVMNTIAYLFKGNIILFIIFAPIVMIIGHSFNIAINTLGAYVHSSRLQYIEFFGKFYEGGGKAFNPFKMNTKYFEFTRGNKI